MPLNLHLNLHPLEAGLLAKVSASEDCTALDVSAVPGDRFGILVLQHRQQVGIWSCVDGTLQFRALANWIPFHVGCGIELALSLTIQMATGKRWQI